jgi:hypothetical protein
MTDSTATDTPKRKLKLPKVGNSNFDRLLAALCFIGVLFLFVFLVFLAFQSMHIYADLGRMIGSGQALNIGNLGSEAAKDIPLVGWLISFLLWMLAGALKSLQVTFFGLVFIMLFICLQTAEVAPTIVRSSPTVMENMIATFQKYKQLEISDTDDKAIAGLKKSHNEYYSSFLSGLDWARNIAYAIDFTVCVIAAPIIIGGYSNWSNVSLAFGWDDLDYTNLLRICITMFFFQWVVWVIVQVLKGLRLFSRADVH